MSTLIKDASISVKDVSILINEYQFIFAATTGNISSVIDLLNKGINPNIYDGAALSNALLLYMFYPKDDRYVQIINILLKRGVKLKSRDILTMIEYGNLVLLFHFRDFVKPILTRYHVIVAVLYNNNINIVKLLAKLRPDLIHQFELHYDGDYVYISAKYMKRIIGPEPTPNQQTILDAWNLIEGDDNLNFYYILSAAASVGNIELVQFLYKTDPIKFKAVSRVSYLAVIGGNKEVIDFLWREKFDFQDEDDNDAVFASLISNRMDIFNHLIKLGVNMSDTDYIRVLVSKKKVSLSLIATVVTRYKLNKIDISESKMLTVSVKNNNEDSNEDSDNKDTYNIFLYLFTLSNENQREKALVNSTNPNIIRFFLSNDVKITFDSKVFWSLKSIPLYEDFGFDLKPYAQEALDHFFTESIRYELINEEDMIRRINILIRNGAVIKNETFNNYVTHKLSYLELVGDSDSYCYRKDIFNRIDKFLVDYFQDIDPNTYTNIFELYSIDEQGVITVINLMSRWENIRKDIKKEDELKWNPHIRKYLSDILNALNIRYQPDISKDLLKYIWV